MISRLQQFTKKRKLFFSDRRSQSPERVPIEYSPNTLLGLPTELLYKIVQNLEYKDWLVLCLSCRYLHDFVDIFFLYHDVKLGSKDTLHRFRKTISKHKKTNLLSLYVRNIEFNRPIKDSTETETTSIAGFEYSSSRDPESYIYIMLEIISLLPNISEIKISEIKPGFQFPDWSSTLKTYAHEHNYYPSIKKLSLSSESGWNIALRPNLLWPFGLIEELELSDMIIDSSSLTKPNLLTLSNESGPLVTRESLSVENRITWSPIKILTLSSCSIATSGSRLLMSYFKQVTELKLINLKSHYDLLLSHCFANLEEISIDLNSKGFSLYNPAEANSINVDNLNSNFAYFNSMFVPKFYINYNKFEDIINKLPLVNKITLTSVSFTNLVPIDPDSISDEENNNLVNNNLYSFLKFLSKYSNVEFIMLKNYKLHQSRTKNDWESLLRPCFTNFNSVKVKDRDGSVLFTKNTR
ncbi:F-box protein [Wickerhamomyces ciferrii]|uniref:F-box protein n=1 Tax=Wickerhamomyces ciferrii (strain ATCC 14091 / BCRC 22168 / CBS 111 / JCM 3599 / NBRC 0793 / NRRL Y-1031 F-60-10) TaxID=1206466 RepID=K0KTY6_WICCF|nr:F-box protein [Wickerhamomyces ciferrii]CCH46646.1 F-box protein [Wickerhamomyces ciferrii]